MSFIKLKGILFRWGEESFSLLWRGFSNAVGRWNVNLDASFIYRIVKTPIACENVSWWTSGQIQAVQCVGLIWKFVRYRTYFRKHLRKFLQWFLHVLVEMCLRLWRKPADVTSLLFIIFGMSRHMAIRTNPWRLEKYKCCTRLEEEQHLKGCWSLHSTWEDYGANSSGIHFWALERQEGDWEQLAWHYQWQVMPDQPNCLLQMIL